MAVKRPKTLGRRSELEQAGRVRGTLVWWLAGVLSLPLTGTARAESYTATAAFNGDPPATFITQPQPNKVAAAATAQLRCAEHQRARDPNQGFCELVKLNGQALTTTSDIRRRLPTEPHPLFLWRYETGGAIAYLAGSVHILKPGLYPLPEQFEAAYAVADTIVLEVDLSQFTPQVLQTKTLQYGMLESGKTLRSVMSPELYDELGMTTQAYGLPLSQLQQLKPAFVTQQLTLLALMSIGYDPNQGVESYFIQRRGERGILELESIDFQLDLLMNQPLATQIAMVRDTLRQMPAFEALTTELIVAWLSGDDAAFQAAFEAQTGDSPELLEFMRQLLEERNARMADRIAELLEGTGTFFVLAGSAHFVGKNSIIEYLDERGLRGHRLHSDTPVGAR